MSNYKTALKIYLPFIIRAIVVHHVIVTHYYLLIMEINDKNFYITMKDNMFRATYFFFKQK